MSTIVVDENNQTTSGREPEPDYPNKLGIIEVGVLTNGTGLMKNETNLTTVHCSFPALEIANSMFEGCTSLKEVDYFIADNVTEGVSMFESCEKLETINCSFDKLENGELMFWTSRGSALSSVNCSKANNLTNGYYMFYNCKNLTEDNITFGSFNESLITGDGMFANTGLTTIPWSFPNLQYGEQMFASSKVTSCGGNYPSLINAKYMFMNTKISGAFSINTEQQFPTLTYCEHMFKNCPITSISFDVSSLDNGVCMFSDCTNLTTCESATFKQNGVYQNMFSESKFDAISAYKIYQAGVDVNVTSLHIGCGFPLSSECEFASTNSLTLETLPGDNSGNQWRAIEYPNITFKDNSSEAQSASIIEDDYTTVED